MHGFAIPDHFVRIRTTGPTDVTFPPSGTLLSDASGIATITGDEAGNATLNIQADESDDTADRWSLAALAASATLEIANAASTSKVSIGAGSLTVLGIEAGNAAIVLDADEGDDNADTWTIQSTAADNDLDFINHTTTVASLTSGGALQVTATATVLGAEAGNATLNLYADESDDTADRWSVAALASATEMRITNASFTGYFKLTGGAFEVVGNEAGNATLTLAADEGDDSIDSWSLESNISANSLLFINGSSTVASLTGAGVLTVTGGLTAGTITPDTKFCTTEFVAVTGTTGVTLTNVVGLTGFAVIASGVYEFEIFINGVATANCGHKIGLKLTTTVLTSANYGAEALLAASMAYTQGTTASDQMSLHAATTATLGLVIRGRIIVTTGGTIDVQAAQNAAHADETKVYVGSYARFKRIS